MIKIVCLRCLDRLRRKHPRVKFSVYIDDFTLTAEGTDAQVLEAIIPAFQDLVRAVQDELQCNFA